VVPALKVRRRRRQLRLVALGSAAMVDVEEETVLADGAVRARAIVKGIAMVSSALQRGSHRSRPRRSTCDICGIAQEHEEARVISAASATFLCMQRGQQCFD